MSILSADAVAKLERVRDAILAQPELYDQNRYYDENNACGGACCLAGWLVWNEKPHQFKLMAKGTPWHIGLYAARLLGVSANYAGLFGSGGDWEGGYNARLASVITPAAKARVAAEYINYLIKRDGPKQVSA